MHIHLLFVFSVDCDGDMYDLCFLQYTFKFGEHDVKVCCHGNARYKSESYIQTQPSTLEKIKEKQDQSIQHLKELWRKLLKSKVAF